MEERMQFGAHCWAHAVSESTEMQQFVQQHAGHDLSPAGDDDGAHGRVRAEMSRRRQEVFRRSRMLDMGRGRKGYTDPLGDRVPRSHLRRRNVRHAWDEAMSSLGSCGAMSVLQRTGAILVEVQRDLHLMTARACFRVGHETQALHHITAYHAEAARGGDPTKLERRSRVLPLYLSYCQANNRAGWRSRRLPRTVCDVLSGSGGSILSHDGEVENPGKSLCILNCL